MSRRGLSLIEIAVTGFLIGILGYVVLFSILHTARATRQNAQIDFGRKVLQVEMESALSENPKVGTFERPLHKSEDGKEFRTVLVFSRPADLDEKLRKELMDVRGQTSWSDGTIHREVNWSMRVAQIHD